MTDKTDQLDAGLTPGAPGDWRALAEKALRGADFDDTLVRETADGVERGPVFFDAPDHKSLAPSRNPALPWAMRQTIVEPTTDKANTAALADLMGGVSQLELRLDPSGDHGLEARDRDSMDAALKDVDLSIAPVSLDAVWEQAAHAGVLMGVLNDRGLEGVGGGLGLSPIEYEARRGVSLEAEAISSSARMTLKALEKHPDMTGFRADGSLAFEAGGTENQELGFMAACGAAYMRALIDEGASPDIAARAIEARLAADADIHLTIAKLRAARKIWARIAEAFGASERARVLRLHAVTANRMMSAADPWTNLIRTACAGFAAAAGAADAITIRPLTDAIGRPTRFARRTARNLHILLAEESHIGVVNDPAAGSYLHENLTQSLAESGWRAFQAIEARGGARDCLRTNWLQGGIAAARQTRIEALQAGDQALIGVTKFPDPDPRAVKTDGAWPDWPAPGGDFDPMAPMRLAERFESEEAGQ